MNLDDYIKKIDLGKRRFANKIEMGEQNIFDYRKKVRSPYLLGAMKIFIMSEGNVQPLDLLSRKDLDELAIFVKRMEFDEKWMANEYFARPFLENFEKVLNEKK